MAGQQVLGFVAAITLPESVSMDWAKLLHTWDGGPLCPVLVLSMPVGNLCAHYSSGQGQDLSGVSAVASGLPMVQGHGFRSSQRRRLVTQP